MAGFAPAFTDQPDGCVFHPRCPHCTERCRHEIPAIHRDGEHMIRCYLMDEGALKYGVEYLYQLVLRRLGGDA